MATKDYRGTNYVLGIRNNNPGNLRPGDNWQGMVGTNKNFIVFSDIVWGLRALATDLSNKYFKGLNTIEKIITVYAPPSENNTAAYISAVSHRLNMPGNQVITNWNKDLLAKFVRAIVEHECGPDDDALVTDDQILEGISKMSPSLLLKVKGF